MRHGSLFSGIGGFDLAAEWMGWENVFHCEIEEFPRKVLKHYWPNATSYEDIKQTDFTIHRGELDILTGGFPCQPYSVAGKRKGKEDDRHIWPEMLRAIREIEPTWVVGENVRGLIGWNGGMVFDEVQADLEAIGYEVQPFLLPACGVNAPHRRDRVWFVAYSNHQRSCTRSGKVQKEDGEIPKWNDCSESGNTGNRLIKNTNCNGRNGKLRKEESQERRFGNVGTRNNEFISSDYEKTGSITNTEITRGTRERIKKQGQVQFNGRNSENISTAWQDFPTVSPICDRNDGISKRLVGVTFPKFRNEGIKAMGNAIVPQLVLQIFKAIEEYENNIRDIR